MTAEAACPLPLLEASSLFSALDEDERAAIAKRLHLERYNPGDVLIHEGDLGDRCYLVHEGMVEVVTRDLIGHEIELAVLDRGQVFGESALIRNQPRSATVRAITELEVYVLELADFLSLAEACPAFGAQVNGHVDLLQVDTFLKRASPFARLPRETLQRVITQLKPRRVSVGETIFSEGEVGDRFYLLRHGRVEALHRGRRVGILEAGDCFGETALIADQPRSATMRAIEDSELWALSRSDFQAVVREHPTLHSFFREITRIRYRGSPEEPLALPDPVATLMPLRRPWRRKRYWRFLLAGTSLFSLLTLLAAQTGNRTAEYAALTIGAFIGPVVYVTYLAESNILAERLRTLALTFVLGAVLGLPLAIALQRETGAMPGYLAPALLIALIEETGKILGVLWLLPRPAFRFRMDGVIYGAAAGMGFAALENLLYGLARIETVGVMLATLWLRALLSPFVHGTWTAIVCASLWRVKGTRRLSLSWVSLGAFGIVVLLHGLWNWRIFPIPFNFAWLLGVGAVGVLILRGIIQRATGEERASVLALNPEMPHRQSHRATVVCRACRQVAPVGARYCPRCSLVLRLERASQPGA